MINRGINGRVKLSLYPAVIAFFTYCNRNVEAFAILTALIIIDFFLWITKSYVLYWGKSITSSKARVGILAKLSIVLIPLILWVMGKTVWVEMMRLAPFSAWLLALAEAYSIVANIAAIRTGKDVVEFDAISYALKKMLRIIRALLEKKIK